MRIPVFVSALAAFLLCIPAHAIMGLESVLFVPMKRFEHAEGLPPKLIAVFDVACNQTFLKTIRHEEIRKDGKSEIYVGGLVVVHLESSCANVFSEVKAEAGTTYSGRSFEVHSLQVSEQPATPKAAKGLSTPKPPAPAKRK